VNSPPCSPEAVRATPRAPGETRTLTPLGHTDLNRARLPFRHQRLRADTGSRTRGLLLGKEMLGPLSYIRMDLGGCPAPLAQARTYTAHQPRRAGNPPRAPPRCRTGRPVHTKDECAPTRRAYLLTGLDSNQRRPTVQSRGAPADRATGHREPPPGATPGLPFLQGTPGRWSRGRAACARRESDPHSPCRPLAPQAKRVYRSATSTWSRHPVPTRAACCTRAGPQPCAAALLAILASNQETPASEAGGSASSPNGHQYGRRDPNRMGLTARQLLRLLCIPFHHARAARRQRLELRSLD
jgi:hypothetical protein